MGTPPPRISDKPGRFCCQGRDLRITRQWPVYPRQAPGRDSGRGARRAVPSLPVQLPTQKPRAAGFPVQRQPPCQKATGGLLPARYNAVRSMGHAAAHAGLPSCLRQPWLQFSGTFHTLGEPLTPLIAHILFVGSTTLGFTYKLIFRSWGGSKALSPPTSTLLDSWTCPCPHGAVGEKRTCDSATVLTLGSAWVSFLGWGLAGQVSLMKNS